MKRVLLVLTGLALLAGCAGSGSPVRPTTTGGADPNALSERLQRSINEALGRMDNELSRAASQFSILPFTGAPARTAIRNLQAATAPDAVDGALVSREGKLLVVEPAARRRNEGADVSAQPQVVDVKKFRKPVVSAVFRAAAGFDAVDFEYPVLSSANQYLGSVSILFRPADLLGRIIAPAVKETGLMTWVMQKDGLILYEADAGAIGQNLFSAPAYANDAPLRDLGRRIAEVQSGYGSYVSLGDGTSEPVVKEAAWTTAGIHGVEWRVVVTKTAD